jgi:hypothetical protein
MRGSRARFANVSRVTERPSRAKTWGGRLSRFDHAVFRERFAASRSRVSERKKSAVCPWLSTARNRYSQRPAIRTKVSPTCQVADFCSTFPRSRRCTSGLLLSPPPDGRVIRRQAAFRQQLFQIPKAQAKPAVQSYADHTMLGSSWLFRNRGDRPGFVPSPYQIRRCDASDKRISDFGLSVTPRSYSQETRSSSHLTLEKVL